MANRLWWSQLVTIGRYQKLVLLNGSVFKYESVKTLCRYEHPSTQSDGGELAPGNKFIGKGS